MEGEYSGPSLSTIDQDKPEIYPIIESTPTTVEEIADLFKDAVEIDNIEDIIPYFEANKDQSRVCIAIPITTEVDEIRRQELLRIGNRLRKALFEYVKIDRSTSIGADIEMLIGEATSDIGKHTVWREKFKAIYVLAIKDNLNIVFQLANPSRPNTDLSQVNQEDSGSQYELHGQERAREIEADLMKNGCKNVVDGSYPVKDERDEILAVERKISIDLPGE